VNVLARLKVALSLALGFEARRQRRERGLLLKLCRGDEGAVERLIEGERARTGVSEAEACRRAIRRLRLDNR
jgi:hypothetical protein